MKKLLVGLFAVAMVVAFTAPTMAAEWDLYGSARMQTFEEWTDTADDDVRQSIWDLQGNSRWGAKVKGDNGISGRVELAMKGDAGLRLIYGTWDFGGGTLLLGQDYTPTTDFISNQVWDADLDLIGFGMPYGGRQPQIRLNMGDFQLALVTPKYTAPPSYTVTTTDATTGVSTTTNYADSIETTLPKIEMAYNYKTDMFFVRPYLGLNTYDIRDTYRKTESITSWLGGLTFGVTPGAFFFKGGAFYSLNPKEYGLSDAGSGIWMTYSNNGLGNSSTEDVNSWGFQALAGFKVNDGLTIEAGGGMTAYDKDDGDWDWDANSDADATDWSMYGNASITLAPGFFIVPEVGYLDIEGDNNDSVYVGAKWQINF